MLLISLLVGAVAGLFVRRVLMSILIMSGLLLSAAVVMSLDGDVMGGLAWFFANLAAFEFALVGVGLLSTFQEVTGKRRALLRPGLGRTRG